jgi:hypothetical protein
MSRIPFLHPFVQTLNLLCSGNITCAECVKPYRLTFIQQHRQESPDKRLSKKLIHWQHRCDGHHFDQYLRDRFDAVVALIFI